MLYSIAIPYLIFDYFSEEAFRDIPVKFISYVIKGYALSGMEIQVSNLSCFSADNVNHSR